MQVASDVKESCKLLRCTVATFTAAATLHLSGVQPALAQVGSYTECQAELTFRARWYYLLGNAYSHFGG